MQSEAVAPSSSTFPPFSRTRDLSSRNPNSSLRFSSPSSSLSLRKSLDLTLVNGVFCSSYLRRSFPSFFCFYSSSSSFCSESFNGFSSVTNAVGGEQRPKDLSVKAASVPDSAGEVPKTSSNLAQTLELGFLLGLWYLFNIYFNIFNKQVLKVYPFPLTVSAVQFAIATVVVSLMWAFNICKRPRITTSQLLAILPLAILHTLGNLSTNISLGKVSVSFTHTIKAMEPFFTVVLSALFVGEMPTLWVVFSLVPIVGGVALASLTEASFNWIGFWSAMSSNLANQSRNVFSKKIMVKKEESLDNITLFSIMTIMSFVLNVPVTLFMEGIKFTPSYLQSAGLNIKDLSTMFLLAGICFHAYQQLSYMILERVSPVTHSVSNCVKRVVVIVASVLFFRTPVLLVNALGTGVALAGVFLYSRAKQIKTKPKMS